MRITAAIGVQVDNASGPPFCGALLPPIGVVVKVVYGAADGCLRLVASSTTSAVNSPWR